MSNTDRRGFLAAGAFGLIGLIPGRRAESQSAQSAPSVNITPDVTNLLTAYVIRARYEDLPEAVRKEACRTLLNWAGCTVGGSRHETVDVAVRALGPFS